MSIFLGPVTHKYLIQALCLLSESRASKHWVTQNAHLYLGPVSG